MANQSNPIQRDIIHSTEGERRGETSLVLNILLVTAVGALQEVPKKAVSIHLRFQPNPWRIALNPMDSNQQKHTG